MKKLAFIIFSLSCMFTAVSQNNLCFSDVKDYQYSLGPFNGSIDLEAGDFNNDGFKDVVVLAGSNFSLCLGNGTGYFGTPIQFTLAGSNSNLTAGDIDNDGKMDLAILSNTNIISLYRNLGSNSFSLITSYTIPVNTTKIQLKDINQDNFPDLFIANLSSPAAYIYPGTGAFTYTSPVTFNASVNQKNFILGDFNNDTQCDIAYLGTTSNLNVFNLNSSFGPIGSTLLNYNGSDDGISAGDFNNDNLLDIVTFNSNSSNATLKINSGSAASWTTFTKPLEYPGQGYLVGDFDNNGYSDIATGYCLSDVLSIRTFTNGYILNKFEQIRLDYTLCNGIWTIDSADMNNDGNVDIIALSYGNRFFCQLSNGNGTFKGTKVQTGYGMLFYNMVCNFDPDNKPDLVKYHPTNGRIVFSKNNGLTFDSITSIVITNGFSSMTFHDLNGDSFDDMLITKTAANFMDFEIQIYKGLGNGTFSLTNTLSGGNGAPRILMCKDLNNDNKPEILASYEFSNTSMTGYYLYKNNGNFNFNNYIYNQVAHGAVNIADVNHDNLQDIILGGGFPSTAYIMLGNGTLSYTPTYTFATNMSNSGFDIADMNGDGHLDIVLNGSNSGVDIFTNNGTGVFTFSVNIPNTGLLRRAIDLNRDKRPDLVCVSLVLYENTGGLNFTQGNPFYINHGIGSLEFAEFNNDSLIDIISSDITMYNFSIHYNTSAVISKLLHNAVCFPATNTILGALSKAAFDYNWNPGSVNSTSLAISSSNSYSLTQPNQSGSCISNTSYSVTFAICTKIKDKERFNNNINVYPTVSNDIVYIDNTNGFILDQIVVSNIAGQTIRVFSNVSDEKFTIPVQDLPNGMYLINIAIGKEKFCYKIIKTD